MASPDSIRAAITWFEHRMAGWHEEARQHATTAVAALRARLAPDHTSDPSDKPTPHHTSDHSSDTPDVTATPKTPQAGLTTPTPLHDGFVPATERNQQSAKCNGKCFNSDNGFVAAHDCPEHGLDHGVDKLHPLRADDQ
jgi:hypothetical protein